MDYKISLDIYEGSIDTLHSLVKSNEIDILEVPLARMLEEFCQWIKTLNIVDLDRVGDFLALAAHLLLMKVRMLLPRREFIAEEFDEETLLNRDFRSQLIEEYRKFREIAQELAIREESASRYYSRSSPFPEFEDEEEGVSFFELLKALNKIVERVKASAPYEVSLEEVSLESRVEEILKLLNSRGKILFEELFSNQTSRVEIIITFIAVLELVKLRKALVRQEEVFGDIWVYERN